MSRFLQEPPSARLAASVIVVATLLITAVGGILMRPLDGGEYPNVWVGMWWALQTVTTIGYGDVTPKEPAGRIVASFVMLEGVAAGEREDARAASGDKSTEVRIEAKLDELVARLERLETVLGGTPKASRAVDGPLIDDPRLRALTASPNHDSHDRIDPSADPGSSTHRTGVAPVLPPASHSRMDSGDSKSAANSGSQGQCRIWFEQVVPAPP